MPQDRRRPTLSQPLWTLNTDLFSLEALSTSEGLEAASIYLQTASSTSSNPVSVLTSATAFLTGLDPCTFPLLLSYDATLNQEVSDALSSTFPTTLKDFMNSTAEKALDNLKTFYLSLPPGDEDTETSQLHALHFRIHMTGPALTTLLQNTFGSTSVVSSELRSPVSPSVDEGDGMSFSVKKQRKKKSRGASIAIDDNPFRDIGASVPRGLEEADRLGADLLDERKGMLKMYMACLSRPVSHKHALNRLAIELMPISPARIPGPSSPRSIDAKRSDKKEAHPYSPPLAGHLPLNSVQAIQLLEEDVKDFGAWKILLSGESMRHLRQISRSDRRIFDIVRNTMKKLSHGQFTKDTQKRLIGRDTEVPIFEAKMTRDTRLVYTIDCIPDTSGDRVTQAIKMFGVYTHAQINSRLWAAVAHWSSKRGPEYRKRCTARETSKQQEGYVVPLSWPAIQETYEAPDAAETNMEFSLELHALLTHEKFVILTQPVLDSINSDEESTHPFCVSHREHEIIHHPSSCFVIGRSGTGKTTTMLFKMLLRERISRGLGGPKVRQVFVTQSRVLAERVEEYFNNLIQSYAGNLQSTEEREWRATKRKEIEKNLVELDEEDDSASNLPLRFSELEDKHFPLFLTFDKLCRLLEAEVASLITSHGDYSRNRSNTGVERSLALEDTATLKPKLLSPRERRILYEDFRAKYWPHLPQFGTKGLDPALVWNEFQGVIRGSELSLTAPNGSLDRETYEGLSFRTQATFSGHRSRLYALFEVYAKLKRERGEVDSADRTHALLQYMQDNRSFASFDYIYVDEVQDNLLIDARLLRSLCRNPHGLFLAGDTAQQITSTAFRFSDLKAFLHRLEESDPMVEMQKRAAVHPKAFTLSINYRSHGGIINCAHSVVKLLTELWPDSIDALDREQGLVDGPKPAFFTGWDAESAHYEQFLFGEANHRIEFGAQQCILVRNDASREKLRQQIGDVGVIMTLYESKGLEFSDVLLYNFFEDSSVKREWRVVLNAVEPEKRVGIAIPAFNKLRHVGVCSELKFLYVGLTRARNNLWIWDTSPWAEPMKKFWESRGQIDIKKPGDHVPRLAVSSTVEEWNKMGRVLFSRGNYQQAVICFDRAEMPLLREISRCFHLRKLARLLEAGSASRKAAFLDVADRFSQCAAGEHDQSQRCYLRAGECYAESGKNRKASDAFCKAREFTKGAQFARKAADFDRAAEIVQCHSVDKDVGEAIIGVCRVYFLRQGEFEKARSLSDSDETFLEHFDNLGFDKSPILIKFGQYEEAADIRLHGGKSLDAIKLYLQSHSESSMTKARSALLEEWWRSLPIKAIATAGSTSVIDELSRLSDQVGGATVRWKEEIATFQAIVRNDIPALMTLSQRLLESGNILAALRGFFHAFREPHDIRLFDMNPMRSHLNRLYWFGTRLRSILNMVESEFTLSGNTQKLLGYRIADEASSREAILLPSSVINQRLSLNPSSIFGGVIRKTVNGENVVATDEAGRIGRELLIDEFKRIAETHCTAAQNARMFQPICIMNITKSCQRSDCRYLHVSAEGMKEAVNHRFGLFLHQILVINTVDCFTKSRKYQLRRIWVSRFLDVLHPQINVAGKLQDIRTSPLLNQRNLVHQGLIVLREWIRGAFYGLNPTYTNQMLELFLLASAIEHYGVPRYFRRAYPNILGRMTSDSYRVDNKGGKQPLAVDLYNALFAHSDGAMENGVGYIHHMITTKAHLDVHLLVCVLETTTTRLLAGLKPDLHGLIIPSSWLFTLAQHQIWPTVSIMAFLSHLLKPLIGLVQDIEDGCAHLSVEGRPVRDVQAIRRIMLIKRIFRCMVLAGCNFESSVVRNTMIGASIASLKSDEGTNSTLPTNYMNTENWDELARAATQSPTTDPVIQLVCEGNAEPVYAPAGVLQRTFRDTSTLFLSYEMSPLVLVAPKSKLSPTATEYTPQILQRTVQQPVDVPKEDGRFQDASGPEHLRVPTEFLDESNLEDPFTEIHHDAARKIQALFRRFRRRVLSKTNPVNHWFDACFAVSKSLQISRPYRPTFLGPFPHFLLCVDSFRKYKEEQKNRASRQARTVDQSNLEEAMERLGDIMNSRRHFFTGFHELKPTSTLHKAGDIKKLGKSVENMCKQIKEYCMEEPELGEHFERAYKGILQAPVKKVVVAPTKPSLNTSDLYE